MEAAGQLNIFSTEFSARQVQISHSSNPFAQALEYDAEGDTRAIEMYELAIERDVRKVDALINVATLYAASERHIDAIDRLALALVLDPGNAIAHYNLGNVYLDSNNTTLAQLHYEMAIKVEPTMADAMFNLALVYLLKSERDKAMELLDKYKKLLPEQSDIQALLEALGVG